MEQEIYTNTLCKISDFPSFEMLEPLSTLEAGKLFQLEAPACVLGHILNPLQLNQDMIIASSQGKLIEQTKELTSLVNRLLTNIHPAKLNSVTEHDQIISLYLDIAGLPEWKALSYNGSRYSLYLEPG